MPRKPRWTPAEDELLARLFPTASWGELQQALSRSKDSIQCHASALGLKRTAAPRPQGRPARLTDWTAEQESLLAQHYPAMAWPELQVLLGRSKSAIFTHANRLALRREADRPDVPGAWNAADEALLEQHYPSAGWPELLRLLPGRSQVAIQNHATKRGLRRIAQGRSWSVEEDEWLVQHYAQAGRIEMLERLDRSISAIYGRASRLGLLRQTWTAQEDEYLKQRYPEASPEELVQHLGRPYPSITAHAWRLGLRRLPSPRRDGWTVEEDEWLTGHYAETSWDELVDRLKRTRGTIEFRARRLGLRRKRSRRAQWSDTTDAAPAAGPTPRRWTAEEDAWLVQHYASLERTALLSGLRRSKSAIELRARGLGLVREIEDGRPWTTEEDAWLGRHYAKLEWTELVARLDREQAQILSRARRIGLRRKPRRRRRRRWTEEQDAWLTLHYATADWLDILRTLNRSKRAIYIRASRQALRRRTP